MIIDYESLDNYKLIKYSNNKKLITINNLFKKKHESEILRAINKIRTKPTKVFMNKGKLIKKEYNNFNKFRGKLKKLVYEINSKKFINKLEKIFKIKGIYPDKPNLYSGINISYRNCELKNHIDFNYNNHIKKFRILNLLLYLNKNYKLQNGGRFFITYDKKKKYFNPSLNKTLIFLTNNKSPHGFTKVKSAKRVSLNIYYYTIKDHSLSKNKHKTLWKH